MHIQDSHWSPVSAVASGGPVGPEAGEGRGDGPRTAPLRVDAQRNLEHVLRAAREVFGELGYGAPMEDVARRARVGVGTVYRRFPSKDVLVRRIAEEETSRLTDQARTALGQEDEPWSALQRFLRTSVASGAGGCCRRRCCASGSPRRSGAGDRPRVPEGAVPGTGGAAGTGAGPVPSADSGSAPGVVPEQALVPQQRTVAPEGRPGPELRLVERRQTPEAALDDPGAVELLDVVGRLVDRARAAGELRADVTVSDVLLVIATAAPSLPDAAQQAAASARLLDILLEGLRSRPHA